MAISGQVVNDTYLAGVLQRDLHVQLLWSASSRRQPHRPTQYKATTWSWAAIDGMIIFENDEYAKIEGSPFHILDTQLAFLRDDATGPVKRRIHGAGRRSGICIGTSSCWIRSSKIPRQDFKF